MGRPPSLPVFLIRETNMKSKFFTILLMIFLLTVQLFGQTADTTRVTGKSEQKKETVSGKSVKEHLTKDKKVVFDRFIDMDGDGICDSRGNGFGLSRGLLLKNSKNMEKLMKKGGKNGKNK